MTKLVVAGLLGWIFVLAAAIPVAWAQQLVEGTVVSTTLTACDFKPGTCEGTAVLEGIARRSTPFGWSTAAVLP